jgi:uncharacterized protein
VRTPEGVPADEDVPAIGAGEPVVLPRAVRHATSHRGEPWEVTVALPPGEGPFPSLVVLDPAGTFLSAVAITRVLTSVTHGLLEPLAVIGVGPVLPDGQVLDDDQRARDLPPDAGPMPPTGFVAGGGADGLVALLVDRLLPALEATYPLARGDRTIAGASLSGLFACHAIASRPDAFRRCIALSPSLWVHDRRSTARLRDLPAGRLADRALYLCAGEHEGADWSRQWPPIPGTPPGWPDLVDATLEFAGVARDHAGATVHADVLAGESHATTPWAGLVRGLIALHGQPR